MYYINLLHNTGYTCHFYCIELTQCKSWIYSCCVTISTSTNLYLSLHKNSFFYQLHFHATDTSTLDNQMAALAGTRTSCTAVRRLETICSCRRTCLLSATHWSWFPSRLRPTLYHPELFVLHLFIPIFFKSNSISPNHLNLGLPLSPPPQVCLPAT